MMIVAVFLTLGFLVRRGECCHRCRQGDLGALILKTWHREIQAVFLTKICRLGCSTPLDGILDLAVAECQEESTFLAPLEWKSNDGKVAEQVYYELAVLLSEFGEGTTLEVEERESLDDEMYFLFERVTETTKVISEGLVLKPFETISREDLRVHAKEDLVVLDCVKLRRIFSTRGLGAPRSTGKMLSGFIYVILAVV